MDLYVANSIESGAHGESWVFFAYANSSTEATGKILTRIRKDYNANRRFVTSVEHFLHYRPPEKVELVEGVGVRVTPGSIPL
jgi:hypothetical protein